MTQPNQPTQKNSKQEAGEHAIQIDTARDITIKQKALLRGNLTITGDGNIVGNDNTVSVVKQDADYAIQIGRLHLTISADELHHILTKDTEPRQRNLPILGVIALVVVAALVVVIAIVAIVALSRQPTPTPTPNVTVESPCRITGPTEEDTFRAIIERETYAWSLDRQGRTSEALDCIDEIFFPDAYISSHDSGSDWYNPADHYSEKFSAIDVFDVTYDWRNFKSKIAWSESGEQACLSLSTDEGKWEDKDGVVHLIENDHTVWYFRQDDSGCWRIARFFYNDYKPPHVTCE